MSLNACGVNWEKIGIMRRLVVCQDCGHSKTKNTMLCSTACDDKQDSIHFSQSAKFAKVNGKDFRLFFCH